MEPRKKRPRISHATEQGDLDTDLDLQESRARNDLRLKSTFENIFRKYEHDFTGIGDEVDLQTGEIVVNNGHIMDMRNEHDIGDWQTGRSTTAFGEGLRHRKPPSLLSEDFDRLSDGQHDEVKVCADIGVQRDDDVDSLLGCEQSTNAPIERDSQMEDVWSRGDGARDIMSWNQSAQSRGLPSQQAILSQFGPILGLQVADLVSKVRDPKYAPVEEAWRVPGLATAPPAQRPILNSLVNGLRGRSLSPLNQTSIWAVPRSTGRRKKDGSFALGKAAPTDDRSITARPKALTPDNTQKDLGRNDHNRVQFGASGYSSGSKRKLHESPKRHLPLPQENGPELYTIEQSNTGSHHRTLSQPVNRKDSYTTPLSPPLINPNTLRHPHGSSPKRQRLQPSKQTGEPLSGKGQSLKKQDIENLISPGRMTTCHSGADSQTLVSPRSNQSPLVKRKRQTHSRWTLEEEKLLRHLKENTDVAYPQLVEYFPGKTKNNIRAHYIPLAPGVKLKTQKSTFAPRPPYTPQEDELLLELRVKRRLPWKDTMASFPARTASSLTSRYYRLLENTPTGTNKMASVESTSPTSEDDLHIGHLKPRLALDREEITPNSLERAKANRKVLCEVSGKGQPLLPSGIIEKTPAGDRTTQLESPSSAALKVVARKSASKQQPHQGHGESVSPIMATPDSVHRHRSKNKDLSVAQVSSLKSKVPQGSKSSHKKGTQGRSSQSTPTASTKQKVTKPRTPQTTGTKASPRTLTPRSKTALVSLLGDVTDDEDELSKPAIILGTSDGPLTTPNRNLGQGHMGSKSCERKFCFKCM